MAVVGNCGTTTSELTELEEAIGDTTTTQINVSSGGMAVIGSNNVIKANNIDLIQCVGLQQKPEIPENTVSGEYLHLIEN